MAIRIKAYRNRKNKVGVQITCAPEDVEAIGKRDKAALTELVNAAKAADLNPPERPEEDEEDE